MASRKLESYDLDASALTTSARELLREYSGIPEEDINSHVEAIPRAKAFETRPYPCIGMFQFLDLSMNTLEIYPEVLTRIKQGEKFLDLGCCLGQEVRKLVFDGAPSVNTYGSDLWSGFFTVGYELFRDKDRLQTTFVQADIFDESSPLTQLAGRMNIIYTGAFFHLFSLEEQEKIALRVVDLLVPQPGSLLIGRHSGSEVAGDFSRSGDTSGRKHFRHNPQSWQELWDRVGKLTGTRWAVEADLHSPEFTLAPQERKSNEIQSKMNAKGLRFVVRRL